DYRQAAAWLREAGNRNVLELHGTNRAIACLECGRRYDPGPLVEAFLKTDVVLHESIGKTLAGIDRFVRAGPR
ncbi:MAG: hypothetical protein ABIK89_14355, partial [Planctomycetota bacterium]